ncbi:hypothetical protein [Sphingosinicella terrae]|uniref:hypothetical protein n=1 Tax=Sphingosinicella terrae TaxID=2172047 RepID=UPI000E0CBFDA|nr:hypothetical protein [Sphingosinicella terrae]
MNAPVKGPAFEASLLGALARSGLTGMRAMVRLEGDVLTIRDPGGRSVIIPAEAVERMRVVRFVGGRRRPLHETKIWRAGASEPLLLIPIDPIAYARTIRAFAGRVADRGGLERVMRGPGLLTASINLLLINGSLGLLALATLVWAWFGENWLWWLVAAAALAGNAWALRDTFRHRWPRRVARLDELDREFPPEAKRP